MNSNPPNTNQAELLAGVLDSSLDGIMAFTSVRNDTGQIVDFTINFVNKQSEQIVGRQSHDLLGKRMLDILPGNKADGLFDAYIQVVETNEPFYTEHHYAHDGLDHWFSIKAAKCSDGFTVTFSDITERKLIETRAQENAERLNEAQELANIGNWHWDPADNKIIWSDQTKRMFGVPLDQPAPDFETHQKQIHPEDRKHWQATVDLAMSDHQPYVMQFRAIQPDGSTRVILARGRCEVGSDGHVSRLFGTTQDITEQEISRQKIKTANERFELLVSGNASGIWDWDCQTDQLYWSPRFKEMIGYADHEIEATLDDFVSRLHPDDKAKTLEQLDLHLRREGPYDLEYRMQHKAGHFIWCHASGQAQWDEDGQPLRMAGSIAEITERKADEVQIKKLSLVASRTENGVVITDADGRVEWINRAFVKITGYSLHEMMGKRPGSLLQGPLTDIDALQRISTNLKLGKGFHETLINYNKSGEPYWVDIEVQPIRNEQGEITNYMAIEADVSQRINQQSALQAQQQRLEFALQASSTGLWDWHVVTGETYFSDTWYTMLGYEPGEVPMTVESWMSLTEPTDLEKAKSALESYFNGETERYACEMRVKNKAGDWQWILDVGEAVERDTEGNVTRMVGLHVDIDEQKRTQGELETARDQAQQASAAKSAFVANMSHEIRTPMNAILGYADLLLDGGQDEADKRNHAQTIRRNGKHLMGILNDILDLSKIEAGKLAVEDIPGSTSHLLNDVINLMAPKANEKRIELKLEKDKSLVPRVMTDPTRVKQVLLNLVGNAIKFTEQGEVCLRASIEHTPDGLAYLKCDVTDSGIGISQEQIGKLFQPFSQADESTTRKFGGTGLGLAISKNLCTLLGGKLSCTSTPEQGSTFTATFKIQTLQNVTPKPAQRSKESSSVHDDALKNKKILIVEDGPDNQRLFNHYTTKAGAKVELAENGAVGKDAALKAWQDGEPFDIVLMDMQMPVLDGYDATGQLRDAGYDLPVIALTAHASDQDREKCLQAGCTDYLSKPVDRQQLIQTLANHLSASQHLATNA
ncbi:MAG: PAS domain-containing protein [Phycisphaeraceae bacterium]